MANIKVLNSANQTDSDTRLYMSVSGSSAVSLSPSRSTVEGIRRYSYFTKGVVSKFPRNQSELYNDGPTYIDFQLGTIRGAYLSESAFTTKIPSSGTSVGCAVHIDSNDRLYFLYGVQGTKPQVQNAIDNFITDGSAGSIVVDKKKSLLWVVILSSVDGVNLTSLQSADLKDCRSFFNEKSLTATGVVHQNSDANLSVKNQLLQSVNAGNSAVYVPDNVTQYQVGESVTLRTLSSVSSVTNDLVSLGQGAYEFTQSGAVQMKKVSGSSWALGSDYNYGDDLTTVPLVGNKLYGSVDGVTLYHDTFDVLSLKSVRPIATNLSSYSSYVAPNRTIAIDPARAYAKFGTDVNFGDGRDGSVVIPAGISSLNSPIGGITYGRTRKVSSQLSPGDITLEYSGADLVLSVGDFVLLYVAQAGSSSSAPSVGKYDLLKVSSAVSGSITFGENVSAGGVGVTSAYDGENDSVFVLTVPQFQNLTLQTGATLTCASFNPSNGGGILAFAVKGLLDIQGTALLDVSGKGYRGATVAGGKGEGWLIGGYNTISTTTTDNGGGGGAFGVAGGDPTASTDVVNGNFEAFGGTGGGAGGTGGGAGGGGGYSATGGAGGYGGAAGAGAGGGGATSINGATPVGTGNPGAVGGSAVSHTSGTGGAGGTALSGGLNSSGSNGASNAQNATVGGAGGSQEGSADVPQFYFGGGGGAAGFGAAGGKAGGVSNTAPGSGGGGGSGATVGQNGVTGSAVGGNGGGVVLAFCDTINNLTVQAKGTNGGAGGAGGAGGNAGNGQVSGNVSPLAGQGLGGDGAGGGGGGGGGGGAGAGGTVLITARVASFNSVQATAGAAGVGGAAGSGGAAGTSALNSFASASGGGAGGAGAAGESGGTAGDGRVRFNYYQLNSSFYPSAGSGAASLASSPSGYLGETPRIDSFWNYKAAFNFTDPNSDFNFQTESVQIQSISTLSFGTPNPIPAKQLVFTSPMKKSYSVSGGARVERGGSQISTDIIAETYGNKLLFDSGFIAASSGSSASGLKHPVRLSANQFSSKVFIYASSVTDYENATILMNSPFINGSSIYGVYLDIFDTTLNYVVGKDGLYFSPVQTVTSGYIRIVFVLN